MHVHLDLSTFQIRYLQGLVLSSVANLVHLCGEDVGSNPAWKISCR